MPLLADPAAVGQIDVISVASSRRWSEWQTIPGEVIATWTGDRVRVALELIASLPEAEQMRCFVPRFGIRLRAGAMVLAEVAFCFRCRNARVHKSEHTPELEEGFTFDPDSPPAQELLRLFQACAAPA